MRVEPTGEPVSDDFLDHDGHLLIVGTATSGFDVAFRTAEVRRCVDELHRLDELVEASVDVRLVVRDHLGPVDTGKRVEQRVFEQAGGSDRKRRVHLLDQGAQVAHQIGRQRGVLERVRDPAVRRIGTHDITQTVLADEPIECVGRNDRQRRDLDGERCARLRWQAGGEHILDLQQPTGFSPGRPRADACERFGRAEELPFKARRGSWPIAHTQPRSLHAFATRLTAMTYAASRMNSFSRRASSLTARKADVIFRSSFPSTSSLSQ